MANVDAARTVYEEWASIPRSGPFPMVDDETERKLSDLQPRIWQVIGEVANPTGEIAYAPSPWHALVMLQTIQSYASQEFVDLMPDLRRLGTQHLNYTSSRQRPIFRGHADSAWKHTLTPRIERDGFQHQAVERRAVRLFCELLAYAGNQAGLSLEPAVHVATAQHYGLDTSLLDWTPDPDVAVWFAATGQARLRSQQAVVYLLRHADAFARHRARLVLPPPFVRRLHEQRGIFVLVRGKCAEATLRRNCREVRLPLDPSFRILREGREADAFPPDPWLEAAVNWARQGAQDASFPMNGRRLEQALASACRQLDCPSFPGEQNVDQQRADWAYFMFQMLLWLAVRPGAASGRDLARTRGVSIEPLLAAAVRRDNPDLVAFFSARPELLLMRLKYKGELDIVSAVLEGCQTIWQREPQRWKRLRKMFGLEDD